MRFQSPAKINLHLRVGGVRSDGFHPLHTWMVTVGLFDILDFLPQPAGPDGEPGAIDIRSAMADLPTDDRNLIVRAARLLRAESNGKATSMGVRVDVAKAVPMGGGLGGGSSNAATALKAFNELWAMRLSPDRLSSLAASLGSDVPFFLGGRSSLCGGRGERITPVAAPTCGWAVLMLPDFPMPTAAVYRRLDELRGPHYVGPPVDNDLSAWATLTSVELLPKLINDLEAPAFAISPDLARLRNAAENVAGRPVRMSGSGSTLFTLFDSKVRAEAAGQEIQQRMLLKTIAVRIAP